MKIFFTEDNPFRKLVVSYRRIKNMTHKCPFCQYSNVTEDWFYNCPSCGIESCPDCAGRCLCSWEEEDDGLEEE